MKERNRFFHLLFSPTLITFFYMKGVTSNHLCFNLQGQSCAICMMSIYLYFRIFSALPSPPCKLPKSVVIRNLPAVTEELPSLSMVSSESGSFQPESVFQFDWTSLDHMPIPGSIIVTSTRGIP